MSTKLGDFVAVGNLDYNNDIGRIVSTPDRKRDKGT